LCVRFETSRFGVTQIEKCLSLIFSFWNGTGKLAARTRSDFPGGICVSFPVK